VRMRLREERVRLEVFPIFCVKRSVLAAEATAFVALLILIAWARAWALADKGLVADIIFT
jgi:hypothetical protein